MRTLGRQKTHIQPMKSPSPDPRNRNYIKDTLAPVQQIQKYKSSRSKQQSPRISNSLIFNNSSTEVDRLKSQISILREQLRILRSNQSQYRNIINKNNLLTQQVTHLNAQIENLRKKQSNNNLYKLGYSYDDNILKQFTDRVTKLSQQNKRLIKRLQDEGTKNEGNLKQNENLKIELSDYKKMAKNVLGINPNQQYFIQLQKNAQQISKEFQHKIFEKMNLIEIKMEKIINYQNILEDKIFKYTIQNTRTQKDTPTQQNKSIMSIKSIPPSFHQRQYYSIDSPMKILTKQNQQKYKLENIKLSDKVNILSRQLDHLRQSFQEKQIQINTLQQKIKVLNTKIEEKPMKQFFDSNERQNNQSQVSFLREKVNYLELDSKKILNKLNNAEQQCALKQRQFSIIKKRVDQTDNWIKNEINHYQATINQFENQNRKLQQQNKILLTKISNLENQTTDTLLFKEQLSKLPKLMEDIKLLEEQMDRKGVLLSTALKEYLLLIQHIKAAFSSEKVQKIILEADELQSTITSIQSLRIESVNVIGQLKKKILMKQEHILQLQKNNNMLKTEIQQLVNQQIKLKQLIEEYSAPQIKQISSNQKQVNRKINLGLTLKQCIEQAMLGISKLQSEVNAKLFQINEYRDH